MTKIEWTHLPGYKGETWNPVVGCEVVSPGCTNCYAMRDAWRKNFNPKTPQYHGLTKKVNGKPVWTGDISAARDSTFLKPLRWKKPRCIFVNSMSDLFHENVSVYQVVRVFGVMAMCPEHIFIILTKRPDNMRKFVEREMNLNNIAEAAARMVEDGDNAYDYVLSKKGQPLPNVWVGVSAEDQKRADERIPDLLKTPAAKRIVSCEPLLGELNLEPWLEWEFMAKDDGEAWGCWDCESDYQACDCPKKKAVFIDHVGSKDADGCPESLISERVTLNWVLAGGESGPGARPAHPDWFRSLRDQCAAAETPFFFKQWGEWYPGEIEDQSDGHGWQAYPDEHHDPDASNWEGYWKYKDAHGTGFLRVGKKAAGSWLDGRHHHDFPETEG